MAKVKDDVSDLLIVGGGPAGAAAAIRARALGLSVLVIEQATFPRPRLCGGWMGTPGVELATLCGCDAKRAKAIEFSGLRLRSWDLKKEAEVRDKELCGWFVDRTVFDGALIGLAAAGGAMIEYGVAPTALNINEQHAAATLTDGREVRGRIVVIADGIDSATAVLANVPSAARVRDVPRCAHMTATADGRDSGLEIALGAGRASQLATIVRAGGQIRVSFMTRDTATPVSGQVQQFLDAARAAGVLPKKAAFEPVLGLSGAGTALDVESHVGKRSLLIGDAGGFVSAFSNEGIYPAMKSGWLAAETAATALKAGVLQDELSQFSSTWRAELADYLRMPNTDLSLLLPLVFSNAQMSKRVARAFLTGQKF